jgi:hypothetical protein
MISKTISAVLVLVLLHGSAVSETAPADAEHSQNAGDAPQGTG